MIDYIKKYAVYVVCIIAVLVIIKQCEQEPKIVVKTETKYIKKTDTIIKTVISKPETVYVQKVKTVKGDTEIVYVNDTTQTKANKYQTTIKSNNASADISIVTSGELLDVSGVIHYTEKETTVNTFKTSAKSGLFVYGQVPINTNNIQVEVGLAYQFKNTILLMGGVQYNDFTKSADFKVGVGIKVF